MFLRVVTKVSLLLVVVVLVLFPRFWRIPTWLARLSNPEQLIQPDHPGLAPLEADLRAAIATAEGQPAAADASPAPMDSSPTPADSPPTASNGTATAPARRASLSEAKIFRLAEDLVYKRLPYGYDWDVWGEFDWWPTVDEALAAGREDCDGRAVVTASLLRRMGYEATLVMDVSHVWVRGAKAEAGSLGGTPSVVATSAGAKASGGPMLMVHNAVRGLALGMTIFPPSRQLVLMAAIILLTLHPRTTRGRAFGGAALILAAWLILRDMNYRGPLTSIYVSLALAVAGWWQIARRGRPPTGSGTAPSVVDRAA
jgi:hypothetical protein